MADVLLAGELEIRPEDHLAFARGRALRLTLRELQLLTVLAGDPGRIVTREALYASVWGGPLRHDDRSVDVYIHKVRTKLADALPDWRFIHTHFGFGYRFHRELTQPFHK